MANNDLVVARFNFLPNYKCRNVEIKFHFRCRKSLKKFNESISKFPKIYVYILIINQELLSFQKVFSRCKKFRKAGYLYYIGNYSPEHFF